MGLGYVGLPLALEFARAGYRVTGFDTDPEKAASVNAGHSRESHTQSKRSVGRSFGREMRCL